MGRYITTTGTAGTVLKTVGTTYQAVVNDRILCTSGGFTITLPLSTSLLENDTIQIVDVTGAFGASNVTIARNGAKIQNLSEDLTLDINNSAVTLVYTGATYGWIISGT
jgi:hypothetical protein|tara:strand:- start:10914 stop:11240 length:327 start_codon:yes stop_codon:yes gene_type:complete